MDRELPAELTREMLDAGHAVFELESFGGTRDWLEQVYLAMVEARANGYDAAMKRYPIRIRDRQ